MGNAPIRVLQILDVMDYGGIENVVMNYYRHIDRTKVQFDFVMSEKSQLPQKAEIESYGGKCYLIPSYTHLKQYSKALSITKQKKTNLDMYDAIKEYYAYTKVYPELCESGVHAYVFACIATYDNILKNKDYTDMIPILKEGVFKNYKIALTYETVKNRKRQLKIFRYLYFLYPLAYRLFMKKRDKKTTN